MSTHDADLIRALHDEHGAALWRYVLGLTRGDSARAEDVVQETYLRAWRNVKELDDATGTIRGWLFTVAHRIVIDDWRSRSGKPELTTAQPPEQSVSDDTEHVLQAWMVATALNRLTPAHRRVLVECFYRGRTVTEVAALLGVPEGTIKSRTHYALRALRIAFEEMGVSE